MRAPGVEGLGLPWELLRGSPSLAGPLSVPSSPAGLPWVPACLPGPCCPPGAGARCPPLACTVCVRAPRAPNCARGSCAPPGRGCTGGMNAACCASPCCLPRLYVHPRPGAGGVLGVYFLPHSLWVRLHGHDVCACCLGVHSSACGHIL